MSEHPVSMDRIKSEYLDAIADRGFADLYEAEWDRAIAAHDRDVRNAERERCVEVVMSMERAFVTSEWGTVVRKTDARDAIRAVPVEPQQKEGAHKITQVPPWPPHPEATYMLSEWECSCGWKSGAFKDNKDGRSVRARRLELAEAHAGGTR